MLAINVVLVVEQSLAKQNLVDFDFLMPVDEYWSILGLCVLCAQLLVLLTATLSKHLTIVVAFFEALYLLVVDLVL